MANDSNDDEPPFVLKIRQSQVSWTLPGILTQFARVMRCFAFPDGYLASGFMQVTGDLMIFTNRDQLRFFSSAFLHHLRASGIESTSRRGIDRRRHVTRQMNPLSLCVRIGKRNAR